MKKRLLTLFALGLSITAAIAQGFFDVTPFQGAFAPSGSGDKDIYLYGKKVMTAKDGDWTTDATLGSWTNWDPQNTVYPGDANYNAGTQGAFVDGGTKSGDITSNTTWGADNQKTLIEISGGIHVTNGAILTIKPNTIIRGNATNISFLLISKGSKLYAVGTPDKPIVFTSIKAPGQRTSGDWAGFLLMGKSQNNTAPNGTGVRNFEALPTDPLSEYGGGANFDIHDNSGEMRFLRIEFAGYNYLPDQEINGVTFGAVGDQTRFDFCQVSYSRDDSYEWFGGTVNHKYLIAWAGIDDEFDMDEGYQGKSQFLLGVRKNNVFETSAGGSSHGFEHDNNTGWGTSAQNVIGVNNPQPATRPTISNASIIGPRIGTIPNVSGNRFNAAVAFRTGDETNLYNSIAIGYPRQFETFHNSASLTPSAQEKLIGGPLTDFILPTITSYTANQVKNVIILKDKDDTRPSLGANGGTVESQATPAAAKYDPATGAFSLTGTLADNAGLLAFINIPAFGNTVDGTKSASDIFTQPYHTVANLDFRLAATSPYGNSADFTSLANQTISGVGAYSFIVSPGTLPLINSQAGTPSAPFAINVSAFGLTGTGIAINVDATNFEASTDGGTTWAASSLPVTGGTVWVRYNAAAAGNNAGTISFTPADGRLTAKSVNVSGIAVTPKIPFITVSTSKLPAFYTSGLSTSSNAVPVSITGNLLAGVVTVTAPVNFEVSNDGTTFSSTLTYSPTFRQITPVMVFVRYTPVMTNDQTVTVGGVNAAGNDNASITFMSEGAPNVAVGVSGKWGYTSQVGPKNADGTIRQNFIVPSFPTFVSYLGVPSASQVTYVAAQNIPAGQNLIVNVIAGMQLSLDNVNFAAASLTISGANGSVPPTPVYARYNGVRLNSSNAAAFGNYGNTGSTVIAVGLSGGASILDKFIGLQGATANLPAVSAVGGTVTTTGVDNIISFSSSIDGRVKPGVALYSGTLSGFLGVVTTVFDNFNVGISNTVPTAYSGALIYATATTAGMINAQTNFFESNKDFNRGALIFPSGNLLDATNFDVNSQQPVVITVSGYTPAASVSVGRDVSTEYSLRYEVSKDGGATWLPSVSLAPVNGWLAPTPVWVRYNPTGTATSGIIAGNPITVSGFGQHTGAIAAGGITIYTIGYSDPVLFASSWLPAHPAIGDVIPSLADLRTIANTPSIAVPLYIWATRLQSDLTVSSNDEHFEFSLDGMTSWSASLSLSKDANFNYSNKIYVRFNPGNSNAPVSALINIISTKVSQTVNVNGFPVAVPQSFINTTSNWFDLQAGAAAGTFSVSGGNLTSPVVITAPAGFQVWSGSGSYSTSVSLAPTSVNYGDLAATTVLVTFTGTTSVTGELLTLTTAGSMLNVTVSGTIPTGIESELDGKYKISLYPNPTTGNATLTHDGLNEGTITVYSYTGNTVYASSFSGSQSKTEISNLGSGFYLVVLSTKEGTKKLKLIVE